MKLHLLPPSNSPCLQDSGPGPQPANFNFGRLNIQPIASPGRGNHNFEGKTFLLSWKEEGRPFFSWQEARAYCQEAGMRMVSLDSEAKREHFLGLTASESLQYFWTGGRLSADKVGNSKEIIHCLPLSDIISL